ncbi:MAG: dUTP diphosphatase [Pseudomonadota bacterium]|nr:dUTP diphosphatase [Pseudomonadota bacterium]
MKTAVDIVVQRLPHAGDLPLPAYQSAGAAGMDIAAALSKDEVLTIGPGERALVPSGFAMAMPEGYEGQMRPRSGLALKQGVTVLNSPGTIDADYRGEVRVLLVNLGAERVEIRRGDRIAQLVIQPVAQARLSESRELEQSLRGSGGFGSTGTGG